MKNRLGIFTLGFIFAFCTLVARLFYWQVLRGGELAALARTQHQKGLVLNAPRGSILASDGTWLASSVESWLLYADIPNLEEDINKVADQLAPLLIGTEGAATEKEREELIFQEAGRIKSVLSKSGLVWIPIKHKIGRETKSNIEALGIKGLGFEKQEARMYPEASSAAHLLGFVGRDEDGIDKGYFGLEGFYDLTLSGQPGFITRDSDVTGAPIVLGEVKEIAATEGVDLVTNIDKPIQLVVEEELEKGIKRYGAKSGTVVIMNPNDGAVLAIGSLPKFDPQTYWEYGDEYFINPAVSSSFEPGSVFKVIIMASALDAGVVEPDTKCDICSGPIKVDRYSIETWNNEYRKDASMTDVIVHSDNVGMVFVGKKLGKDKMYEYLDKFGIGELTGVDLQGEMTPALRRKDEWSIVDVATASFGQGIAVTPIQMVRAVSAIANKGEVVTPRVVDKLKVGGWEEKVYDNNRQRIISEKAAREVTAMMVEAAKNGEAKWTYTRGFNVAGKTGTAQIPIAGHYDEEKTIASFIGFAPSDDPKFVMLVTLREPKSSPWASETAAPLWYSIASDLFLYFGIQPEN